MVTISLCMIVKNEEAVLERCLNSVSDDLALVFTAPQQLCLFRIGQESTFNNANRASHLPKQKNIGFPKSRPVAIICRGGRHLFLKTFRQPPAFGQHLLFTSRIGVKCLRSLYRRVLTKAVQMDAYRSFRPHVLNHISSRF